MAKQLIIENVVRTQATQPEERLSFAPGVNVVVGPPNTGKTGWLKMINYVLSSDERTEDSIGVELAEKYDTATVCARVGDAHVVISRRWKEPGNKGKVFVNDAPLTPDELSHFLMEKLDIPILHYPQGNPMGPRSRGRELSWRTLYRHIYRRQRFWSDLADQQPESEQHACILQFAGLAQYLFSDDYGALVKSQKRILELQARKEQFIDMLQEVSKDIVEEPGISVALTPEALVGAIQQIESKIATLATQRQELLRSVASGAAQAVSQSVPSYETMAEELARSKSAEASATQRLRRAEDRLKEVEQYRLTVQNELARLQRAQSAGRILADLKVTHCPACDQTIARKDERADVCYVCGQQTISPAGTPGDAAKRLAFELEQLEAESKEADELLAALRKETDQTSIERSKAREAIRRIENAFRPIQTAASQILPAELSIYDMEAGRLQERVSQLQRIQIALAKRETINQQIEDTSLPQSKNQVTPQATAPEISSTAGGQVASGSKSEITALSLPQISDLVAKLGRYLAVQGDPTPIAIGELTSRLPIELRPILATINVMSGFYGLERLVLPREAARILGITSATMADAVKAKKVQTYLLGSGRKLVDLEECRRRWPPGIKRESGPQRRKAPALPANARDQEDYRVAG